MCKDSSLFGLFVWDDEKKVFQDWHQETNEDEHNGMPEAKVGDGVVGRSFMLPVENISRLHNIRKKQ